ncbi:conserved hypothetical protein [Candidatus Sulfopaludibacter sp. SbA4]|nr:conserved hypothetical protein [Candidatus Sulfopaludibacter sp. SbA4]
MTLDRSLLNAALAGYQHQIDQLDAKMADIRRQLGATQEPVPAPARKKRVMGAAARRKIAAAQRKRWAVFHESKAAPAKKRKMSRAGKKRIAEANKKRWAEFRARKAGR